MSTADALLLKENRGLLIGLVGIVAVMILFAVGTPNLMRSRTVENQAAGLRGQIAESYGPSSYDERIHRTELAAVSTALVAPGAAKAAVQVVDRKMVRTGSIDLVVQKPGEAADRIRGLAEGMGGFLVSSAMSGGQDASGTLTVRVPAARFEEARAEIRKLGLRVENEKVDAQDVTRQYVDQEASLRNLRAEEAQYLTILKQAHTVKDAIEVTEKLSEVRGEIEQQQAEFDALSKQIETVALTISLRAEAEAQVFGLHWRPLYQMKLALRDGLDALAGYAASMTSILFYLPAMLLWLATIVLFGVLGWKVSRWGARVFFGWPKKLAEQKA